MDVLSLGILSSEFPKLETLDLTEVLFYWDEEFLGLPESERSNQFVISGTFSRLRHLNLEKCFDEFSLAYHDFDCVDPLLSKIVLSAPRLETLSLSTNTMITGYCLFGLSSVLQSLDLTMCRRISSETLSSSLQQLTSLTYVGVT